MSGKKSAFDPPAELASLLASQEKLKRELCAVEQQIYNLETNYLIESARSSKSEEPNPAISMRVEGRLFSSSSVTSPTSDVKDAATGSGDDRTSAPNCGGDGAPGAAAGTVPRRRGRPKKTQQGTGTGTGTGTVPQA